MVFDSINSSLEKRDNTYFINDKKLIALWNPALIS